MKHDYTSGRLALRLRQLAVAALLACGGTSAHAQFYTAGNVLNQAGTYTDLEAGTGPPKYRMATTGTAKDNFRSEVNLSSLAPGIYNIKVRNGEEYTMQQISIVR